MRFPEEFLKGSLRLCFGFAQAGNFIVLGLTSGTDHTGWLIKALKLILCLKFNSEKCCEPAQEAKRGHKVTSQTLVAESEQNEAKE